MEKNEELLPCPFCCGNVNLWVGRNAQGLKTGFVECDNGDCFLVESYFHENKYKRFEKKKLIKAWNTRPTESKPQKALQLCICQVDHSKDSKRISPDFIECCKCGGLIVRQVCDDSCVLTDSLTDSKPTKRKVSKDVEAILKELRHFTLVQLEDAENFPTPETWVDNMMVAFRTILESHLQAPRKVSEDD